MRVVITVDTLTPELIREAQGRWPEWISSERAANALGLPEKHTPGGLPLYPPPMEMYHARDYIARVITEHHADVRKPVCEQCGDTHQMELRGAIVACTRCPVPCEKCRMGGTGAFCEHTPCACACHKGRAS